MPTYNTKHELAQKIDYEGGGYEAIMGYGIHEDEVPDELYSAWVELREAGRLFETLYNNIDLPRDPYDDCGEDGCNACGADW